MVNSSNTIKLKFGSSAKFIMLAPIVGSYSLQMTPDLTSSQKLNESSDVSDVDEQRFLDGLTPEQRDAYNALHKKRWE